MLLTEFVSQRLDEDEAVARGALRSDDGDPFCRAGIVDDGRWTRSWSEVDGVGIRIYDEGGHSEGQAEHIARHDPARVLAEVAAKRQIVELHEGDGEWRLRCGECGFAPWPCPTLRALASIWAAHPDYDPAWA